MIFGRSILKEDRMKKIIPLIPGTIVLIITYGAWTWGETSTYRATTSFFSSAGLFSPLGIIGIVLIVIGLMVLNK